MPPAHKHPRLPHDFLATLARLDSVEEIGRLLNDLLTPGEIEALNERWDILRLLTEGRSQRDVSAQLGVSITTVSRGSRQLKYGTGGFQRAFDALHRA
jgi:TrpR-related protein YerC/YecD